MKLSVRLTSVFDVSFDSPVVRHVNDLPYSSVMRSAGCFNSTKAEIGQTLFLIQPKNYQLYQPNLHIQSIEQVTATDFSITIVATRPALFVWLDVPTNISRYFSRNGFHLFGPTRTITYHSWTPITDLDVRITSLFDISQP